MVSLSLHDVKRIWREASGQIDLFARCQPIRLVECLGWRKGAHLHTRHNWVTFECQLKGGAI